MNNVERLVRAAQSADSQGRIGEAERLCREALYVDAGCGEALILAGSIAARRGKNDEAITVLRRAIESVPDSYDATRWLAGLLIGREGGQEAVELAKGAVRLRPRQFEAHALLGMALVSVGQHDEAADCFRKAIELNPNSPGAHHNLGVACQLQGDVDEAIAEFRKALALSPQMVPALLQMGKALLESGDSEEAVAAFEKAAEIEPNSQTVRGLLADATYVAIHEENAEEHLLKTLESFPNESYPHALMGSWLQEQGRFSEAEASIQRSIELKPKQGFGYYLYTNNRKMRETDRPFLQEIAQIAADPGMRIHDLRYLYFALGKAYDDLKEYEIAMRNLDLANQEEAALEAAVPSGAEPRSAGRARAYQKLISRELLDRLRHLGSESPMPIFIFGMPRSGTTLLEQIVSRHSKVGAAGEQVFWRDHRRRLADVNRQSIREGEIPRVAQKYLGLLTSLAPGKAYVTEKFPSNYIHLGLMYLAFPNATFIHAKRHPVDTCLSIYMRPFFSLSEVGHTRESIVNAYKVYREQMAYWHDVFPPGKILDVQYEEMVSQPDETIRRVIAHCGLEWEDACLSPEAGERRVKTFSKWQVRQPVYTTSVARWKNYERWLGAFRELMPDS